MLSALPILGDNEIYVDQSGNTASIDLEQLGSSNLIGGTSAVSGSMTALDLDGLSMTLDINQIGSNNIFRSDGIDGNNLTAFFEYDGDSNVMDILLNSSGTITADYVNMLVDVTGSSNTFDLKVAENSDSSYLDLDWVVTGDSNQFDFDIDYANAINNVDVNGSSNTINFTASGYSGTTSSDSGYFFMDLDGSSNTFNIIQSSTLARDWLKIETNTSNSNICITQNDGGTATGC
ncbi:MAG: hypothetical protein CMJ25_18990 [Phycisphaerae bacterium]|nr:hypothetical protein [Phycisphaerae bacterium]|tara:strand:- start:1651 stop:2352 length:702 start_codon:yes stop_codon:yes gene_type:complete